MLENSKLHRKSLKDTLIIITNTSQTIDNILQNFSDYWLILVSHGHRKKLPLKEETNKTTTHKSLGIPLFAYNKRKVPNKISSPIINKILYTYFLIE